jgi:hypothetical protein
MNTLRLKSSLGRRLYFLFIAVAFVAAGIAGLHAPTGHPIFRDVMAWICIAWFGLCAVIFAINLLPGASCLQLKGEGLDVTNFFRTRDHRWQDIECFGLYQGQSRALQNKVMMNFANVANETSSGRALRAMNKVNYGFDSMLPDTYGMKPAELVTLLEEWRRRAITV